MFDKLQLIISSKEKETIFTGFVINFLNTD